MVFLYIIIFYIITLDINENCFEKSSIFLVKKSYAIVDFILNKSNTIYFQFFKKVIQDYFLFIYNSFGCEYEFIFLFAPLSIFLFPINIFWSHFLANYFYVKMENLVKVFFFTLIFRTFNPSSRFFHVLC